MTPAEYRFVTAWEFVAPIEDVWREVGDPTNWANFWTGLERVHIIEPGDVDGRGATYELVFKSFLPYELSLEARVAAIDPPHYLRMETQGELEGTAVFELTEHGSTTNSSLTWTTKTTLAWMNLIAPLMRGLFEWNHDVLMRKAGDGLAHRIGASVTHREGSAPPLVVAVAPPVLALASVILVGRWLVSKKRRT